MAVSQPMSRKILVSVQDMVQFYEPEEIIQKLLQTHPNMDTQTAQKYISLAQTKIEERPLNAAERGSMLRTTGRGFKSYLKNMFKQEENKQFIPLSDIFLD